MDTNLDKIQIFFSKILFQNFYIIFLEIKILKKKSLFLQNYEDFTILANDSNKNPFWGYNKKIVKIRKKFRNFNKIFE